jgi:hypothetical protein
MKVIATRLGYLMLAALAACSRPPAPPLGLEIIDRGEDRLVLRVRNNTPSALEISAGRPLLYHQTPDLDLHFQVMLNGNARERCVIAADYPHNPYRTMLYTGEYVEFDFSRAELKQVYCVDSASGVSFLVHYGDPLSVQYSDEIHLDQVTRGR